MGFRIVDGQKHHAPFVAWTCLAAARSQLPKGFWDYYLDQPEAECLRYLEALAVTSRPHLFHYSAFLVAELSGRPAAALCGYFEEELNFPDLGVAMSEVDQRLGRSPEDHQRGMERNATFFTVTPAHPPRTWIIENVATWPEFRRQGLVNDLLAVALERGRERGAPASDIGLFIGNDPAQAAYEKVGFRMVSEKRNLELERSWGSPGLRLLRRPY
ncbi:MAG TPA: GNAT family N-acetyltransferase [Myxococcota bacterium]|nr:GNAT family N-acetyltransferase [Myxococcota bacterium]